MKDNLFKKIKDMQKEFQKTESFTNGVKTIITEMTDFSEEINAKMAVFDGEYSEGVEVEDVIQRITEFNFVVKIKHR